MTQNHEARIRGLQPALPLIDPPSTVEDDDRSGPESEWHLDEHTREVGRLGIAAARAALRASVESRRNGTGGGPTPDAGRSAPGRAA